MSRPVIALSALVAVLAIVLGTVMVNRPATGMDEAGVRTLVSQMLADEAKIGQKLNTAAIDPATIHPMVESYLLSNPRILERVSTALRTEVEAEERDRARLALAEIHDEVYNDPDNVVLGNPDGKVTLVEMFDYNCGYCRTAVPDMLALISNNPDLRVILKEFPILSQESVDAARIAVAAAREGVDYWAFHTELFSGRGQVTKKSALAAAQKLGLNPVSLELSSQSESIQQAIDRSYKVAQAVGTSGTPTYIVGNEVIPGAVGLEGLQSRIDNLRKCGETVCGS